MNALHLTRRGACAVALLLLGCDGDRPESPPPPAVPVAPAQPAQQPEPAPLPSGIEPPAAIDEPTAPAGDRPARAPKAPPARREREAPADGDETATKTPHAPSAATTPAPDAPAEAPKPAPAATAPAPAAPAPRAKVVVPSTEHVRIDVPRGLQALLDADPRMQPWLTKVIGVIDRCYASERGRAPEAAGAIQIAVTMHVNARPDADVKSIPAQLGGVVACATPELMRARPPLFTGPEGERHTVTVRFSR